MKEFATIEEALDFAIEKEEEAMEFYRNLAKRMERPAMSKVFEEFAREEEGHRKKLLAVKRGENKGFSPGQVADLKVADYLVDIEEKPEMDYQEALILAMKREKAAFMLYMDLAEKSLDENLKEVFSNLAQEEAKHKLRFELEYDDYVLTEN